MELHLVVEVAVEVGVEGHLKAACGFGVPTNMAEVEGEADCLFWLVTSEKVVLTEVACLQETGEGHVIRRKTLYRPSDRPG